jgi:hypothetical protein
MLYGLIAGGAGAFLKSSSSNQSLRNSEKTAVEMPHARQRFMPRRTTRVAAIVLRDASTLPALSPDLSQIQRTHSGRSMMSTAMSAAPCSGICLPDRQ